MQSIDQEVLTRVRDWLHAGRTTFLCTIVGTYGSSPRPVGSLLACNEQGEIIGSLSGGCVEDDLIEQLRAGTLLQDAPQRLDYGLTASDTERLGLPCGGTLSIVAEPLHPTTHNQTSFTRIVEALEVRECIARSIALESGAASAVESIEGFEELSLTSDANGVERLRHVYGPRRQLFVIGAGMVSRYLADMAQALDFEVTVCDPRNAMIEQWSMPGVRMICAMPDDAIREHAGDNRTAIVALTHDPRIDDMGLMEALTTDAFYIGAMGSKVTSARRRERLAQLGLSGAQIDRLHAPVGLPLGSKTPPEIAVAIVAELTLVTRTAEAAADARRSASP